MTRLQYLRELRIQALKESSPDLPYPDSFVRPYTDKTANALTKAIIDWVKFAMNGQAERISVTGRAIDKTKIVTDCLGHQVRIGSVQWIPPSMTKGSADVSATIRGRSVKIEVKIGHDRQSDAQRKYQQEVERSGGIYLIARNFDQFVSDLNAKLCVEQSELFSDACAR